ncbi:hypothetical protein [Saccharolobus sp. A20]|uniref:hypothetical protein n=2 Tax=Sulfolobaceae TaxID=118883 RepID=UPI000AFD11D5|nr:hypothetical protein [Sulfolobus sp. A20]
MIITAQLLNDSKFYEKPILLYFTTDQCKKCEELYEQMKNLYILSKYYAIQVNAIENVEYTVRLTRGVIPTITILTPDLKILGIIESVDVKFIESRLRDILDDYKNKKIIGLTINGFIPEPLELSPFVIYDTVNKVIEGEPADSRMIEVYLTYTNIYKDYLKAKDKIKFQDSLAEFLLNKQAKINVDKKYLANIAMLVNYGIADIKEVLELLNKDTGEVYRSSLRENKGILLDEALAGNALLTAYESSFDENYLTLAIRIANYIKENLQHEKGFKDIKGNDDITNIPYLEPISNAETAIFFSRLWNITNDESYKSLSLKGAMSALGASTSNPKVLARISIAYMKLYESIKANQVLNIIDSRVEIVKDNNCEKGKLYYDGKCYTSIHEIVPKSF